MSSRVPMAAPQAAPRAIEEMTELRLMTLNQGRGA